MDIQRSTLPIPDRVRTPVMPGDYDIEGSRFTGTTSRVEPKAGDDDNTHLLDPGAYLTALMGHQ